MHTSQQLKSQRNTKVRDYSQINNDSVNENNIIWIENYHNELEKSIKRNWKT